MTKAHQAHLRTLAPYLPYAPQVEHAAHGRGILIGLPACHINDHGPLANVEFAALGANYFPDYYYLESVKLVLWHADDYLEAIEAANGNLPQHWQTLCLAPAEDLEEMAAIVDAARALGIALNLPAGSYIRKEVPSAS